MAIITSRSGTPQWRDSLPATSLRRSAEPPIMRSVRASDNTPRTAPYQNMIVTVRNPDGSSVEMSNDGRTIYAFTTATGHRVQLVKAPAPSRANVDRALGNARTPYGEPRQRLPRKPTAPVPDLMATPVPSGTSSAQEWRSIMTDAVRVSHGDYLSEDA